jgi:hypothetical protein
MNKTLSKITESKPLTVVFTVIATVLFSIGAFFAWRWLEIQKAEIWAAEMRKAGVTAPLEIR